MIWRMAIGWLLWGRPSLSGRSYNGCPWEHATHGRGDLGRGLPSQHRHPRFHLELNHLWRSGSPLGEWRLVWSEKSLCWDGEILLSTGCCCITTGTWEWPTEELELRMEGGQGSHSECMCVVSHGCGRLDDGRDGGDGWWASGTKPMVGRISGDAGAFPECEVNVLITPDRTTIQVRSSGCGRAGIDRSSWKGLDTGRYEKASVRCPCCLHGAPQTTCQLMDVVAEFAREGELSEL